MFATIAIKGRSALDLLFRGFRLLAVAFLGLMSVLIITQVLCRNLLDLGLPWADELARVSGIVLVYLAVPLLGLRDKHVAVHLLPSFETPWANRAMTLVRQLCVLLFCALTLYGFQAFLSRAGGFTTPALGLSNWFFFAAPLIGVACLALAAVVSIAEALAGIAPPDGERDLDAEDQGESGAPTTGTLLEDRS